MTCPVVAVGDPPVGVARRARRLIFVLGIAGLVVVAGGLLAGFDRSRSRSAVDAARHENSALRARQEVLRESAFDLAGRVIEDVERERRMGGLADPPGRAWEVYGPRRPAPDIGNEALLTWLSEQSARLEALECEIAVDRVEVRERRAPVPAPVAGREVPVRDAAVPPAADMGSVLPAAKNRA